MTGEDDATPPPEPEPSETGSTERGAPDSGAFALSIVLRMMGLPADAERIRHQSGKSGHLTTEDLLRALRAFEVKGKLVRLPFERLIKAPLPAMVAAREGGWIVVGRIADEQVIVLKQLEIKPSLLSRAEFEDIWDGRVLLVTRRAGLRNLATRFGLSWFIAAITKYRKPLLEVLAASFFLQIFGLLTPLFFQVVVDKVLVHRGLSTLEVLAAGLALLSVFEVTLGGLRTWLFAHTANRIDVELGSRLFRHLLALPMAYFGARRVGDTVARVRELETIRQFLTSSALTLVLDLFFAFVFIGVLVAYSPSLTLVVVGAVPIYVLISVLATPLFRRRIEEKFARGAENQALLVECVSGVETVKSMALEPVLQQRWEEQLAAYVTASFKVVSLGTWAQQAVQAVNKIVTVAILFLGARQVIAGELTVGELVAFNMLAGQVTQPVLRLSQLWQDFQQARVSVERLGDILNTAAEPSSNGQANLPPIRGAIQIRHVTFRYRLNTPAVLSDISLDIAAGEVIGIVGASGSGKSSLVKLVQRLFVAEAGQVLVDGVDLAQADPAWLRRQLGVVLQDNVLFNRSVRENIAIANQAMTMDEIIAAARQAGAHEFILGLPEGYDTVVGERGATLSGGQRQRIAIARALANQPRILIFDEATSALDYESEAAIQANMADICHGRTVLIVAHRLSTVRAAHRIVVMEEGRVVEEGTHAQLVARGGRYAQLWRIQNEGPRKLAPSGQVSGAPVSGGPVLAGIVK
ncbi:subfamily B ATP-binding cassette protein HlyB/CyaB [Rhodoblastus sphagnicola]|uniref:type I secretion system permease/ATPase n=1 Tax=Rhodoblastus sphagnicola TaxID=333368 RepID=UPI00181EBAE1|nr:type I secretion system permease/ATPase [Rhodoblastus sphagnicola]MBB4199471.1 subfamily B ATP-binding cassette protein HlyB/CyaB [Rhodoblastus sphagnicola]